MRFGPNPRVALGRLVLVSFLLTFLAADSTDADPYVLPLEERIAEADFVVAGRLTDVDVEQDDAVRRGSGLVSVERWLKTGAGLPSVDVPWLARAGQVCPKQPKHEEHLGRLALWVIRRSGTELTVGEADVVLLETVEQSRKLAHDLRNRAKGRPEVIEVASYLEGLELPDEPAEQAPTESGHG